MHKPPDAIVLCGGAGLRLRAVTGDSSPKSMATIGGRPFLELLLRQLRRSGCRRAILAAGYREDVIRGHFGERAFGLQLIYSTETSPLGTGGALRLAAGLVESDVVLAMNGDSYIDFDLDTLLTRHLACHSDVSLVVAPADGRADCGNVHIEDNGRVTHFNEKEGSLKGGYLNAGVYLLSRALLTAIPHGTRVSLETDLFRRWLSEGKSIHAFICSSTCIDIGTPERYRNAQEGLAAVETEAGSLKIQTL